jgi:hypothetical protein
VIFLALKQVSVFLENKSGRLYEMARILGEHGINMRALTVAETVDYGVVRFIADDPDKAAEVLRNHGFTVSETEVIGVLIPDRPGGLAEVLKVLSKKNLNVEYLYCFSEPGKDQAIDVMRIEDIDLAEKILKSAGFELL